MDVFIAELQQGISRVTVMYRKEYKEPINGHWFA